MITPPASIPVHWEVSFFATLRALQYWAEKVQPLIPGQPCCLVESVVELQWAMELLVTFIEVEVFAATAPSNWAEVSSSRPMEPIP